MNKELLMNKIKFKNLNFFTILTRLIFNKFFKKKNNDIVWIDFKDSSVEYFDLSVSKIKTIKIDKSKIDIQSDYYPMN